MEAFRYYLQKLEERKQLRCFSSPISVRYETAAVMQKLEKERGPAARFTNIPPFKEWCLVGNLYAALDRLAFGLNLPHGAAFKPALLEKCSQLTTASARGAVSTHLITNAPIQENVHHKNIDLPSLLPGPIHCAHDSGPFINAGIVMAKDPVSRKGGMQVIMIEVKQGNRLILSPVTPPIDAYYEQAETMNQPLEVAIVIGAEPALMFAACSPPLLSKGDKLGLAEVLRGSPIPLVSCETIDLKVPAGAEVVLEGAIIPREREKMGPWGNYLKSYSSYNQKPVMEVTCVRHRTNPIYQDILAHGRETTILVALPTEIILYQELTASFPHVQDVHITLDSCGLQALISLRQADEYNFQEMIEFVLSRFLLKSVILVDTDIDIYDPADVAWALSTRVQASKDFIMLSGMPALPLDPSTTEGKTDKWAFNATREPISGPEKFQKADLPQEV
ncbi:MAG: UbiD family decarboxylase, partial [Desulfatiglandales bacterium]